MFWLTVPCIAMACIANLTDHRSLCLLYASLYFSAFILVQKKIIMCRTDFLITVMISLNSLLYSTKFILFALLNKAIDF